MTYDFNRDSEVVLTKFYRISLILGILLILLGIVHVLRIFLSSGASTNIFLVLIVLLGGLTGLGFIYPAFHFNKVMKNQSHDMGELFGGIKKQNVGYLFMLVCLSIIIIFQLVIIGDELF